MQAGEGCKARYLCSGHTLIPCAYCHCNQVRNRYQIERGRREEMPKPERIHWRKRIGRGLQRACGGHAMKKRLFIIDFIEIVLDQKIYSCGS